ncbi:MarR family winged helix-turn-helix transcriptional regulator [Salinisphaera sp. Q1T1-3]|uniref:MarR family winged helix-turn-helix transcriptional regulator n=1 Tax=Salinisphaera sp. Q1T1-3 TaxID=2321229 RepID=UPI001314F23F|nr:MarR family winged helix-turn-helix transcriptional regulator [Salinisphaera sp. Q1T1-3]
MSRHSPTGETLHHLMHAYKRALRDGYAEAGIALTVSQIRVLKSIAGLEQATAGAVGTRMRQDKGRITRLLQSLRAEGLVTDAPNPKDSRSRHLRLTAEGRALRQRIAGIEEAAGDRMAAGLSSETLAIFTQAADAMIANLEPGPADAQ